MTRTSSTRTIVFDLDGTLVDSLPDLLASCNRIMAQKGFETFNITEIQPMVGDGAKALVSRIMAARAQAATDQDLHDFLADYMANVAIHTRPYPGVAATLDHLAANGWRLAVCTNKPAAAARLVLAELNLLAPLAAVAGGDSYPTRKPDPAHLLATIADAGGDPAHAIMVGDHHNDMAAAQAANLPAIFVTWGYGLPTMAGNAPLAHTLDDVVRLAEAALPHLEPTAAPHSPRSPPPEPQASLFAPAKPSPPPPSAPSPRPAAPKPGRATRPP